MAASASLITPPYAPNSLSADEIEPYATFLSLASLGFAPALPSDAWSFPSAARDRVACALGADKTDGMADGELRVVSAIVARRALLAALRADAVSKGLKGRRIRGGGGNWEAPSDSSALPAGMANLGLGVAASSASDAGSPSQATPPQPVPAASQTAPAPEPPGSAPGKSGMLKSLFGGKPKPAPAPAARPQPSFNNPAATSAPLPPPAARSFSSPASLPAAGDQGTATDAVRSALSAACAQTLASLRYNPVAIRRGTKPNFTTQQFRGALSRIAGVEGQQGDKTEFGFSSGLDEQEGPRKGWEVKWGAARDLGAGKYTQNEDAVVCIPRLEEAVRMENVPVPPSYFAIFDGHGPSSPAPGQPNSGPIASTYAAVYLHHHLGSLLNEGATVDNALRGAFAETDAGLRRYRDREQPQAEPGCTALVLLRMPPQGQGGEATYYLAHAGDSPCFIATATGKLHLLTKPHNATDPGEVARVEKLGGKFFAPPNAPPAKDREGPLERLQGYLACSRGLGDFAQRPYATWEPSIQSFSRSTLPPAPEGEQWKFILLCSDGVSDFLPPDQLGPVLARGYQKGGDGYYYSGAEAAARDIVREAVRKGGYDNASCTVVEL